MKNIAVLVHTLAVEYAATVVSGVYDFFKDKEDVKLYITQTRQPHYKSGITEYQYWAVTEYLTSKNIDAIIVVSNSYVYSFDKEELKKSFSLFKDKLIFSIGYDLKLPGSYHSVCKPNAIYEEMVGHLVNEHGCKKIAFLSGNGTGMVEAFQRFDAYKLTLDKFGLEYKEEWVSHGRFTHSSAKEVLDKKYTDKSQLDFDAIICANDIMATAAVEKITELGLRVPEDIKVVGFDNTSHATLCNPALTTVDQQIYEQGWDGAALVYKVLNGEKAPYELESQLKLIHRHSCGCYEDKRQSKVLQTQFDYYTDIVRVDVLIDLVRDSNTIEDFVRNFKGIEDVTGYSKMICCITEKPIHVSREDEFVLPEKVRVLFHIDSKKDIYTYYEKSEEFDPAEKLVPDDMDEYGNYIMQPLYLGKLQYGYLIVKGSLLNFASNSICLKLLTSVIIQNYEASKNQKARRFLEETNERLLAHNNDLFLRSNTDELTKVLNRRGFIENSQKIIEVNVAMGNSGLVFFADLDGLKKINDTYGHEYGDLAIQTQVQVLKQLFRQSDIIGRLSGDEFAVVAPGMKVKALNGLEEKLKTMNEKASVEKKLPFTISISFGAVEFYNGDSNIQELLKKADKKLYDAKRIRHAEQAEK